jgi:hypothetical protein
MKEEHVEDQAFHLKSHHVQGNDIIRNGAGGQWLTPVILATQEAGSGGSRFDVSPGQIVRETYLEISNTIPGTVSTGLIFPGIGGGRVKESDQAVNSTMIQELW